MPLVLAAALFLLMTALVGAFGYYYYVRPTRFLDQLNESSRAETRRPAEHKRTEFSFAQIFAPIGNILPVSAQDAKALKQDLIAAGIRSNSGIAVVYGVKIVLSVVLLLAGLLLRSHLDNPVPRMVAPVAGGLLGYLLPGLVIGQLVKRRNTRIRLSLPDVLDLLVVCTEAGCGLDQAIINVSRELKTVHPAVAEELSLVNMEIMAGKSRSDAMRNFARRTGEDEVKKLVSLLVQTDRFGTSIAEALRTQSEFLRIRRRQEAEERAGKVGVKLVFPIFFFCLPCLLVVTAGPGILQLLRGFAGLHTPQ